MTTLVPGNQTIYGNLTVAGTVTSLSSQVPTDPFGDLRMCQKWSVIDLKSTYGITTLRDSVTTSGSGTVTNPVGNAEYQLATTSGGADSAQLASVQRGRYIAGFGAECGIAVRLGSGLTGNQTLRFGYFDANNGFFWQLSAGGALSVGIRRAGSDYLVVPSASFNVDPVDGTGPSGIAYSATTGNIFQIDFCWYGYGSVAWRLVLNDSSGNQVVQVVHRWAPSGQTSIMMPNLPVTALLANNGTPSPAYGYVAGRHFSVVGNAAGYLAMAPNVRITTAINMSGFVANTTPIPCLSVQVKSAYLGVPVRLQGFDVEVSVDCYLFIVTNATLTGANFGNIPNTVQTETSLQQDTSATAYSGGICVYGALVPTGGKTLVTSSGALSIDLQGQIVSVIMYALKSGTSSNTTYVALRFSEEF